MPIRSRSTAESQSTRVRRSSERRKHVGRKFFREVGKATSLLGLMKGLRSGKSAHRQGANNRFQRPAFPCQTSGKTFAR